jgi:D-arabinose 1-dehydrogenase-like Zn-dependent alcohol dehydrogenase
MAKMRAMVVGERGGRFVAEQRDIPVPGPEEMRIRVQACGVCHSDVVTVQGPFPIVQYPHVPGHEVIGVVDALGEGVHGWKVGSRAGVGWFGGSCGYCRQCRRDNAFVCENVHEISGVTRDGGYATHMIAHVSAVAPVLDDLDAVESAPLLCAGVATFNALRHTGAGPGDVVAVHGVGGLGHLGIQFAARQGFRTVAVNRRGGDKEELAKKLGANDYIDSDAQDPAKALTAMGGAKAILATVTGGKAMQVISGGLGPNGVMKAQEAYDRMLSGKARFRVVLKIDG